MTTFGSESEEDAGSRPLFLKIVFRNMGILWYVEPDSTVHLFYFPGISVMLIAAAATMSAAWRQKAREIWIR